jgi:hypothetical protein
MARHILLKCPVSNLINYLFVIKITTFPKLVLFTSSGESRAQTYSLFSLIELLSSLVQGAQQIVMILVRR